MYDALRAMISKAAHNSIGKQLRKFGVERNPYYQSPIERSRTHRVNARHSRTHERSFKGKLRIFQLPYGR